MRTVFPLILALAGSAVLVQAQGPVDRAADAARNTVDTAKNVGHDVVRGTKKVVHKVADAFTPESDARRVSVTLSDDKITISSGLRPGKTAFVVHNAGRRTHNFEVDGDSGDYEFANELRPGQTKVLHVHLTHGPYAVRAPVDDEDDNRAVRTSFVVR